MREVLADLAEVEGVRSAFLAGQDGLLVAGGDGARGLADLEAALVVAAFATIERAISQLDVGEPRLASIETATHTLQIANLGDLILAVIAERRTNLAVIRWEMRRAARRLTQSSA